MKLKEMQNSSCQRQIFLGVIGGVPTYKTVNVISTNKRVFIYNLNGSEIGQAGVIREEDFNFETLYRLALSKSGKSIEVA